MNFRKSFLGIFSTMAFSLLTLMLFLWLTYQGSLETKVRSNAVEHTYKVRLKVKDLWEDALNAETGARGFAMTHDESYLKPFYDGTDNIKDNFKILNKLVSDNPVQIRRIDTLSNYVDIKVKLMKINIENIKMGKELDMYLVREGKMVMDKIRGVIGRFLEMEEKFQKQRSKSQDEADYNMKLFSTIFSAMALIFLIVFFIMLYRELERRFEVQLKLEQNVTELKRANIELEQFSNIASHDLQEPLRKIRTFGERLMRKHGVTLNEDGKFNIIKINESAARMQQLITDLLAFSHTTNVNERQYESVNVNQVFDLIKEELMLIITDRKVKITITPTNLPTLQAIPFQIHQLFSNLLTNAIKYSKVDETPIIQIEYDVVLGKDVSEIEGIRAMNNYHHFSVIDNGIGFESVYSEKIFVIFQRLHNREEYEGTGIGLAICRRIVANHQGFINAESDNNKGSTFHIYLPKIA